MRVGLSLKRPVRRRIQKLDRRSKNPDQRIRCRVVLKVAAGQSCNSASRELGCVPSTAVRIVARFRAEGEAALLDHRSENGRRKIDADVRGGVCRILEGTPEDHGATRPTWTLEILRSVVKKVLRVRLSLNSLCGPCCMSSVCAGGDPGRLWPVRGERGAGSGESRLSSSWLLRRASKTWWSTPTRSIST